MTVLVVVVVVVRLTATSPLSPFIPVPPDPSRSLRRRGDQSSLRTPLLTGCSHTTLGGSMVIPAPPAARRQGRLSAAQSELRVHSVHERLPRDFDLSHRIAHSLSLSLFLFLYSPASCLSHSFSLSPLFPLFPLGGRRAKLVTGEARVVTVHRSTSTEVLP